MSLLEELKDRRERQSLALVDALNAIREREDYLLSVEQELSDLDTAIAALEPAPAEPDAEPLPTMDDIIDPDFTGGLTTEQYLARLHGGTLTAEDFGTIAIPEDPTLTQDMIDALEEADEEDASSDDEDDWDDEEDETAIVTEDQLWTQEQLDKLDADAKEFAALLRAPKVEPEPTELDAPVSIVDDPELQAAVARAEQALAIDAQTCEPIYPHPQPAYVGLQDADLDADYDAMREREMVGKPKLHFSIFGKREDA